MRAYLAAIGCKGEEISRAHLAAIRCNGLIHLQAFQSLKLDSTGIRRSRSVYSKFVVLVKYLNIVHVTFMFCSKNFFQILTRSRPWIHKDWKCILQGMQYFVFMIIILLLSINYHILYSIIQKCTTAGSIQVMLKPVVKWWASCAQAVALYSVPKVPKQYPSSIQAVSRLVIQACTRSGQAVAPVYKECPSFHTM